MRICTHCGDRFKPKYNSMKLCYACWQKRETAFREYDDLREEIAYLRAKMTRTTDGCGGLPEKLIRQLLGLCHPDRHHDTPREKTAKEVTQWLIGIRGNS